MCKKPTDNAADAQRLREAAAVRDHSAFADCFKVVLPGIPHIMIGVKTRGGAA